MYAEHAEQIASGKAAPVYDAFGNLTGINTSPQAISEYARLGAAESDPNLASWRTRAQDQSRPSLKRWTPPEGQWTEADVAAASPEQVVAAQENGQLGDFLGLAV